MRHLINRRYEIAAIAVVSSAAACANHESPIEATSSSSAAVITSAQGIVAAQKAIDFMVPNAIQFTQDNQCLSCHRQPDTLISASIAAQLLPGVVLDTSASTGTGFIANLVTGNQQSDGSWNDSGSQTSMSAESLWALGGYARAGGPINVLPNVKSGLLWLVPKASTVTFPNDGMAFAGMQRTYLNNDFTDSPQMFDWYLPTTQSVFATRVLLDLDSTLDASSVSTLSAQQVSYTDALQGSTMRALTTTTVQHLALTGIAMAESGRASTADGQAIATQILARRTAGSGWGDPSSPDGTLASVNTLTTGEALYALCRLGVRARANADAGSGLDWLTTQQQSDGSWILPSHNSAVSSSWALLAVACASNPRGTAEFNPLTANGSPSAPVSESFTTTLDVTNTSSDPRTATIVVTGAPSGSTVTVTPSTLSLAGDSSGSVTVTVTLPPGLPASATYPLVATASFADSNGNVASQVAATYTIAIAATPDHALTGTTTTLTAPPAGADQGSSVSLSAAVAGSGGSIVHGGTVTFSVDSTVIGTAAVSGDAFPTTWAVPSSLSVGSHVLHAVYSGQSGAIVLDPSSSDQPIDIFPPAPAAPVVSGITDGSSSASGQYNLSGTGTPGDTVAILANGVVVRTTTVGPDGSWGASFSLSPGAYAVSSIETGPGGSSAPTTSNVSVQPTAPVVGGPAPGTTFSSMMTTVSGSATPGAKIDILRDGVVVATTIAGSDGTYSVGVDLVAGPNELSVSQTVGGQTSALSGVTYNRTPSAPSVTNPAAASSAQKSGDLTITGTAVPGATVLLLDNGVVIGSATAGSDGSYSIPVTLPSGQNSLSVTSSVGGVPGAPSTLHAVRVDHDAPFFPVPPVDLVGYARDASGAVVSWPAISAFDAQDGRIMVACNDVSGTLFGVGVTRVNCTASDTMGNIAISHFDVKVILQALPTITLPEGKEIVVKSAIATGANVSFDVTAKDARGEPMAAICTPASGDFFPAGKTKVTCTASDAVAESSTSASFNVTVIPVPYYGVDAGTNAAAPAADQGGCNTGSSHDTSDFGSFLGLGLAFAAMRRGKSNPTK
ncbi:MAG: HYR domain-containing protein [Polyangiaceae bacterium]